MTAIEQKILSLGNIEPGESSLDLFLKVYDWYTPTEWLETDKLFEVSNTIAQFRPDLISVGIRINVQVNLFLRSLQTFDKTDLFAQVGSEIGCFALTESRAGVLSGLYVETIFIETQNGFLLKTPPPMYKNWISQCIDASQMLIFARNDKEKDDIRIFLCPTTLAGVERRKIVSIEIGNQIGLGELKLVDVHVPKSALLSATKTMSTIELLNSIMFGRVMIAEAVVNSVIGLIEHCDTLPKMKKKAIHNHIVKQASKELGILKHCLSSKRDIMLSEKNVSLINSFKIRCVERSIYWFSHLQLTFTTHAMKYPLKFEHLVLNKAAEGDTCILRLSLIHHEWKRLNYLFLFNMWRDKQYVLTNYVKISENIINNLIDKHVRSRL